jgi:hypothetical protein
LVEAWNSIIHQLVLHYNILRRLKPITCERDIFMTCEDGRRGDVVPLMPPRTEVGAIRHYRLSTGLYSLGKFYKILPANRDRSFPLKCRSLPACAAVMPVTHPAECHSGLGAGGQSGAEYGTELDGIRHWWTHFVTRSGLFEEMVWHRG